MTYHDITWVSKVTFFKDSDGLSSFLEKKDFDPSGFCFKSSYQDLVRDVLFLAVVGRFVYIYILERNGGLKPPIPRITANLCSRAKAQELKPKS